MDPTIVVALIGLISVSLSGYLTFRLKQLDNKVNGRLTELLNLTRASALAEGKKAEHDAVGEHEVLAGRD